MARALLLGVVAAVLAAGCGAPPTSSTVPSATDFFDKRPKATEVAPPGGPRSG